MHGRSRWLQRRPNGACLGEVQGRWARRLAVLQPTSVSMTIISTIVLFVVSNA